MLRRIGSLVGTIVTAVALIAATALLTLSLRETIRLQTLYAASTLFTGVPLLTFAAVFLGLLTAAQRGVTGGVLGPITSHLTFSLGMLFLLPPILTLGG